MRVAILTQPLGHNYGGLMQAYALQVYLKKLGCEVETLDRQPETDQVREIKAALLKVLRLLAGRIRSLPTKKAEQIALRKLRAFRDKSIRMSPVIRSESELRAYYRQNHFDVYLVGSDQVWRPKYSPALYNFYLDFVDDVNPEAKRLSFSASFGVDEWEYAPEDTRVCKELIKKFDAVSVREQSAIALCGRAFGITPQLTLDPTLLLEPDDYLHLIDNQSEPGVRGKTLSYVLDPAEAQQTIAIRIAGALGNEAYNIKPPARLESVPRRDWNLCDYPSVGSWLQGFKEASFVVTDSFHGCVFAILFNKPFITVGNPNRGMARFQSLFELLGLQDRLVSSPSDIDESLINREIDWPSVNRKRRELAQLSKEFLCCHIVGRGVR